MKDIKSFPFVEKVLPHLIAVVTFLVVSVFYFGVQYQDKDVRQHDNIQANGTRASIDREIEQYGNHPQWLDNMFGGMPAYTFSMDHSADKVLDPIVATLNFIGSPASYYFLLMLGFYFMGLCFGFSPYVSIVGALAWGLSTYFFIIYKAGHIMKLIALIYVSPLIGSIYYAYKKHLFFGGALAAFFTAMELKSVHPQITYYFLFVILALIIAIGTESYKQSKLRSFFMKSVALLGFALLGIGANSVYLYYTLDYTKESTRGRPILTEQTENASRGLDKDYITQWSYGKMETFNLLVPNLYGGSSEGGFKEDGKVNDALRLYNATDMTTRIPAYWGPQPMTSGPVYLGAVILFLFLISLFLARGKLFISIISVTVLALLLAWGKNFMPLTDLFIDYFPLYNKFRTVSMILVIVEFTIPLLAMFGLQKLLDSGVSREKKLFALRVSSIVVVGILLIFVLFGSFASFTSAGDNQLPQDVIAAMSSERFSMMQSDAMRSILFVLLTAVAVYIIIKNLRFKTWAVGAIALLVVLDLVPVNKRYLNNDDFMPMAKASEIPMTPQDAAILKDIENYRVANFTVSIFNDATTSMYHRSVGGYSAVKPRRYQDLIEKHLSDKTSNVYNMLNTRYFIVSQENAGAQVFVNPDALGNAWFIDSVEWVDTPDMELQMIGVVDLASCAVINNEFKSEVEGQFSSVELDDFIVQTSYRANRWEFEYSIQGDRLVAFSEMYFPNGWSATVDEVPIKLIRINYDFFGAVIPQGSGKLIFEFVPPMFWLVDSIALTCTITILLLLCISVFLIYKKRHNER